MLCAGKQETSPEGSRPHSVLMLSAQSPELTKRLLKRFVLKEALSEETANASCRWMMWLHSGLVSYGM